MLEARKTFAVIRAVYHNRNSPEDFVRELDFVLEKNVNVIIIEPDELGEATWRWIRVGNWLHKTAVLSGFAAMTGACFAVLCNGSLSVPETVSGAMPVSSLVVSVPSLIFSLASVASSSMYTLFWQWDPCAKYQVAASMTALPARIVAAALNTRSARSPASISDSSPQLSHRPFGAASSTSASGDEEPFVSSSPVFPNSRDEHSSLLTHPVVLVRRDDFYRKLVHNSVSLGAVLVVGLSLLRLRSSAANPFKY